MSRILITGGSGFIGSYFRRALEPGSYINFDLVPPSDGDLSGYVQGDVRSFDSIVAALKPYPCDEILCLAAEHKDFGISESEYFATNCDGTRYLCEAATLFGMKRITFYSSVAVYGPSHTPPDESCVPAPISPYGASKLAGEEVVRKWANQDPERSALILRPTVVIGPDNLANMLRLIRQIDRHRYFRVGSGSNVKSIAYVENLVAATHYLRERTFAGAETFNYVDLPQLTVREIGECIAQALDRRSPVSLPMWLACILALPFDLAGRLTGRDFPVSLARVRKLSRASQFSGERLRALGFRPQFSTTEGLTRMVSWYVQRQDAI